MSLLRVSLVLGFAVVACGVDQSNEAAGNVCAGPDCVDAGALLPDDELGPAPSPSLSGNDVDGDSPQDGGNAGAAAADAGVPEENPSYAICAGQCLPDDALVCADWDPLKDSKRSLYPLSESQLRLMQRLAPALLDAGSSADASVPADNSGDDDSAANDDVTSLESAEAMDAGVSGSCQIGVVENDVAVGCWYSGAGTDGDACTSTRDCAPGFACAGPSGAGQCLKYCCEGDAVCASGDAGGPRFCDERPLRTGDARETASVLVPVCVAAKRCDLAEPFPCPDGVTCTCEADKVCTVVNPEGSTGCRVPGEGQLDDPCPCAPGFYCHPSENACKQLCNVERADSCGESVCQAAPGFPLGWGLCQPVAPVGETF